jgi:hypothetical protein
MTYKILASGYSGEGNQTEGELMVNEIMLHIMS